MLSPLFSSERQKRILEILEREGVVRNVELRELLKVSAGTIRADLRELENQGVLEIVHGGAVAKRSIEDRKLLIDERMVQNADAKKRIGARAAQFAESGQTLIVDSGTTTLEFINQLSLELDYLQIVTHGLYIAVAAARHTNVELLMPGGVVRNSTLTLVGPQVLHFFDVINAQYTFLATTGFSIESGITAANLLEAEVKRKIVQRGRKVVLLADSSKHGKHQALTVVPMKEIDVLITDKQFDDSAVKQFTAIGIEVIRV
ncbi:MAG: DeoR/GlpR family DNA-binding transcription regulator [Anaerolineae bacterium]